MKPENLIIGRDTTIKQLLEVNQEAVIDALVKLNKNFSKLRNPFLRKLLARRVSVADACRIANCSISDFFKAMNAIGFQLLDNGRENGKQDAGAFVLPAPGQIVDLDVRPILDGGKDPLKLIMLKINELAEGEVLRIINTFEPLPLINLLGNKGFGAHTEKPAPGEVHTYFFKNENPRPSYTPETTPSAEPPDTSLPPFNDLLRQYEGRLRVIDVTMYEMPGPMMTILENLETLENGHALFVHHKKVPVYLLPHLHDKGFNYLIQQEEETKVSLLIYRR